MDKKTFNNKLAELGLSTGNLPKPGGSYVPVNVRGNVAFIAIQFPIKGSDHYYKGRLGTDLTTDEGYLAARMAALNVLGQLHAAVGLENIEGMNHADIYFQASNEWDEGPKVANGASDLFLEVLGTKGQHTRAIFGVHKLSRNFSVGLTTSFTLKLNAT